MSIDLDAPLRRIRPDKRLAQMHPRPAHRLTSVADLDVGGRPTLLLDTNVYILSAAGRLPPLAAALVDRSLLFHCSVCTGELTTGVGNTNPARPGWAAMRTYYRDLIASFRSTRMLAPDDAVWADAGLIAGTLARTQGFQRRQRKECLNDALIYLTAAKAGLPVLTANRDDFDLIQQLAPQGRFIHF